MRKMLCVLLSAAMVLSADAWGDLEAAAGAKVTKAKKCLFPNSRKRAPAWVCNARADGMALTAVGSAAKSGAGIAFMEQMAAADARTRLARDLRRSVEAKIRRSTDFSKNKADRDGALLARLTNDSLQAPRRSKAPTARMVRCTYWSALTRQMRKGWSSPSPQIIWRRNASER